MVNDMNNRLIYIDGEFLPVENAKISVYDHGLLYGDGVYEGIRAYAGVVFRLAEHIDRLYRSARSIRLTMPVDRDEMIDLVLETLRRNELRDAYIRLIVTRGVGPIGPDPRTCPRPSIIIITEPLAPVHGEEAAERGLRAVIVPTRRDAIDATSHEIKSLNYMNSLLARMEATVAGADEAIVLDPRGFVCESPICNLFILNGDRLATPSTASGILHGITRAQVMALARDAHMVVEERDITPYELINADEVFLTGTHAEIVPVVMINGIPIGNGALGPCTRSLIQEYRRITRDPRNGIPIDKENV
jgi:branched-chain amino acid aminotransferase